MPRKPRTRVQRSFRAEPELAAFLKAMPNTSEFIRRALLAQRQGLCPLCSGIGTVPYGVAEHFAELVRRARISLLESTDPKDKQLSGPGLGAAGEVTETTPP